MLNLHGCTSYNLKKSNPSRAKTRIEIETGLVVNSSLTLSSPSGASRSLDNLAVEAECNPQDVQRLHRNTVL